MLGLALRAVLLDGSVFEEIRERQETTLAAFGIVVISGFAFGLGIWIELREPGAVGFDQQELLGLVMSVSTILSGWFVWTVFVWILGIRLFQGDAGFRGALRSIGVCYAPIALSLFYSFVPMLLVVGIIWILVAGVVAIKNTLDFEWWKAGIAATVGWAWSVGFSLFMLFSYYSAPA